MWVNPVWVELEQSQAFVNLPEPNLSIINDFINDLKDIDFGIISAKIHHILDPRKKLSINSKELETLWTRMIEPGVELSISFSTVYFSSKSLKMIPAHGYLLFKILFK